MTMYINITFGTSSAVPKAVEYDRCMIVGDGAPSSLDDSKIYELAPDSWQTTLEEDGFALGDQFYDSIGIFFAAAPSPQRVWGYAYLSGAQTTYEEVPLEFVSEEMWEIPLKPPSGFYNDVERVNFYCCEGGTGSTYNYADGSIGCPFEIEEDAAGNWTGRLEFTDGLSGAACGIIDPVTTDCKVTCDFVIGSQGGIGQMIADYQINMVSLALENDADIKNYTDNIFGSQLNDIVTMTSAISGKNCLWFYTLPGDADPEDTIEGTTTVWKDFKNLVGAREDIALLSFKPSTLNHDGAAGYMAMTVISPPHKQMSFAQPHFGVEKKVDPISESKWNTGQIASFMQRTNLAGEPFLITFGFTLGSGDTSRIEGTRCKFIIAQTLRNGLWGLLAKRDTLMSYNGIQKVKAVIESIFKGLIDKNIVDKLVSISIPIESDLLDNTVAGQTARAQQAIPAVEIEYYWYTSLEKISITRVENTAI